MTHEKRISKALGNYIDMVRYMNKFGPVDPFPPLMAAFTKRHRPPQPFMLREWWGRNIHDGQRDLLEEAAEAPHGHGAAYWDLIEAMRAKAVMDAMLWVDLGNFSSKAQQLSIEDQGLSDFGMWYPVIIPAYGHEAGDVAPFWCPRLALDGTKAWTAHASRFIYLGWMTTVPIYLEPRLDGTCIILSLEDADEGKGGDGGEGENESYADDEGERESYKEHESYEGEKESCADEEGERESDEDHEGERESYEDEEDSYTDGDGWRVVGELPPGLGWEEVFANSPPPPPGPLPPISSFDYVCGF